MTAPDPPSSNIAEITLPGIDTMAAGNAFLPGFMEDYNKRFAIVPARHSRVETGLRKALGAK